MRVEIFKTTAKTFERWHFQVLYESQKLTGNQRVVACSPKAGYLCEADARADIQLMRDGLQGAAIITLGKDAK